MGISIQDVVIVHNADLAQAMHKIDHSGQGIVFVTSDLGSLKGSLSDGDIRRALLKGLPLETKVSDVMNSDPVWFDAKSPSEHILQTICQRNYIGYKIPLLDSSGCIQDIVMGGDTLQSCIRTPRVQEKLVKKVLVIGGAGYIGSVVVRKLISKGYDVRVLDKFLYGKTSLENVPVQIHQGDTCHVEDLTSHVSQADAVIHLGEIVGDPACALSPKLTLERNYFATKLLGEVCKFHQINRLIYISSCSVYGCSENGSLLGEESELCPLSLYARMKVASENAILGMRDSVLAPNFAPTILRLGTVFGLSPRPRFDLVVNTLTAKAFFDGEISIFGGTQWRPHIHVTDVACAIMKVLESPISKIAGEIFNIGGEHLNTTIAHVGECVQKKITSAKLVITDSAVDKRDYRINFTKSREKLGFVPLYSLEDGINELHSAFSAGHILDYKLPGYHNVLALKEQLISSKEELL